MTDPKPLGDGLAMARAALASAADRQLAVGDDFDGAELEQVRAAGLAAVRQHVWYARIPARFQWATLDDFAGEPVHADLVQWAAKPAGRNLVLLGAVGTGKTHAGVAGVRPAHDAGLEVLFLPVVEALDLLRPGGPADAFTDLCDVDRLVLDDLGSERPTDWTAERLGALINRRWMEERPTVATSNLEAGAGKSLCETIGERAYSRLVGSDAVVVRLTGKDRRRG